MRRIGALPSFGALYPIGLALLGCGPAVLCPAGLRNGSSDRAAWCESGSAPTAKRSGPYLEVRGDGSTRETGAYADGKRSGTWQHFAPDGTERGHRDYEATDAELLGYSGRATPKASLTPAALAAKVVPANLGCDKQNISNVVKGHAAEFRACYEQLLGDDPRRAGRLTTRWIIGDAGRVVWVETSEDQIGDDRMRQCVEDRLWCLQFLAPEAGSCVIEWPFVFTPG